MKKYILSFIILLLAGVNAAWAQTYVAEIGGTNYATLTEAFTAVGDNETIILLDNITISEEVVVPTGKTFTLDLGGKELTVSSQNGINFKNDNTANSSLTIKNGTITGNGNCTNAVVRLGGQGNTLTIASDAIINNQDGSTTIAVMQDNVTSPSKNTLNVYGTVSATGFESSNVGTPAISSNGTYTKSADINIYDGATITSAKGAGVYVPGKTGTTCNITGGTITGASGVYVKAGTLNISGGTINGTGDQVAYVYYGNGAKCTGDALVVENSNYGNNGAPTVSVTGGTFNSTNAQAVASYNYGSGNDQVTGFVSGGSFSSQVPADFLAAGSLIGIDENGDYVVVSSQNAVAVVGDTNYATLAAAIAAATNGETITILKNITLTNRLFVNAGATPAYAGTDNRYATTTENKSFTLDLNGHNITSSSNIALAGGSLNITNTGDADATHGVISSTNAGLAPIEVRGTGDLTQKRTLTVGTGVTLTGAEYGLNVFGSNDAQKNLIGVNVDGTVNGILFVLGNLSNADNAINIVVNGTVDASNAATGTKPKTGIALNGNANVTVNDNASVKGETGIEVRAGNLIVNGGTITATASDYSYTANASGTTTKGAAIAVAQHTTTKPINVQLNGGTLVGTELIAVTDVNNNGLEGVSVTAKASFVENTETKLPGGFIWVNNGNGTYYIGVAPVRIIHGDNSIDGYATLAEAISHVAADETIKLMADIALTQDITLPSNGTFTLDFNGHSINNGNYHVKLASGQAMLTDVETQIFAPTNPVNYVVVKQASGDNTYPYKYNVVKSLTSPDITITVANVTYDGLYHGVDGQNPVSVTVYDANVPGELLAGTDGAYTISMVPASSYSLVGFGNSADNVYKYARTYTDAIIIEGKPEAGYSGRITLDFTIEPRNINDVTVEGHHQSYLETGYTTDGIMALISLEYNGTTLVASTANTTGDYTIDVDATMTYKEEGTYPEAITLTAVEGGNFTGSRKVNFYIGNVAGIDIATCNVEATTVYNGSTQTPTGTGTTPTLIVRDGSTNAVLVQGTDYTITTKSETGYEYINAKTYTDAITISGIGNYYGAKTVDYIITPKDIASCTVNASTPFTGSVIDPATVVTVKDGDTTLSSNADDNADVNDYSLTVSNGYTYLNPQAYANAITVTGMGNYTGSVTKDFTITTDNGINIADGKLLVTSNAIYTGATQVPSATTITVQYDGAVLPAANYDITFAPDNVQNGNETGYKDAQTYSRAITITARGTAYYGSVTADYVIAPRNMNEVTATEEHPMEWTGDALTPVINGDATATNNINLAYGNYKLVANDTKVDYTYTSDPAIIKDPGTYTITFEGRGNFTGTKQLTVHVLKSINNDDVILAENIYIVPNSNNPITPNNIVVKDGANTLAQGPDYTIGIYTDEACTNEVNSITTETLKNSSNEDVAGLIFYVKLTGNDGNSYNETKIIPIYTLREYLPGTLNSTATATPIDLHAAGLSSTANTVNVALGNSAGNNVIAQITTSLTVPATATVTLNNKAGNATTAQEITLNITDIENDAFTGCTALRWIDGTALPASFTPSSLERSVSGTTFSGVPKQALVYLPGTTFTGENYVYKPGDGDTYYCEKFKIYDDLSGSQTGFTGDDYKWAYENIHPFMAYTIENTRMLTAGKHYTTCLPYDLAIPAGMKAYTLDATSDKLFGFSEVTGIISAFTPYVLIPSKSGQLLSTVTTTVPVFTETTTTDPTTTNPVTTYSPQLGSTTKGNFTLYGTMRYMDGTDATGKYIMQYKDGKSTWLSIDNNSNYDGPCILPMRAYIGASSNNGGARSYTATFTDVDGKQITSDMLLDADDSMYYDLQGRKVDTPQRKGLYIKSSVEGKNGRKVIKRR